MSRLYLDSEEELDLRSVEHGAEDEEEEARIRRALEAQRDRELEALTEAERKRALAEQMKIIICSCGWHTCPAVVTYGHPVPIYQVDIRPLPTQRARDLHALALKGTR